MNGSWRLLLLGCSRYKRPEPDLLPAIERYDGPAFRVLRRFLRVQPAATLDVAILSAEFGLFPAHQPIPDYDRRLTSARAWALRPAVLAVLRSQLECRSYTALCVCLGRAYLAAIDGYATLVPPAVAVEQVTGSSGLMLARLHDWLHDQLPRTRQAVPRSSTGRPMRLRGVEVSVTADEALAVAEQALHKAQLAPTIPQAWYVDVDGQRVAPKWLVSQLTGLPGHAFHSQDARRVLTRLGIEVRRDGGHPEHRGNQT